MNNPEIQVIASPVFDRNIRTLLKNIVMCVKIFSPLLNNLKMEKHLVIKYQEFVTPSTNSVSAISIMKRVKVAAIDSSIILKHQPRSFYSRYTANQNRMMFLPKTFEILLKNTIGKSNYDHPSLRQPSPHPPSPSPHHHYLKLGTQRGTQGC